MYISRITIFLIAAALAGCATPDKAVRQNTDMLRELTSQDGRACFQNRDVRGYGVLDKDVISIDGGHRYYIATMQPACIGLQTAMRGVFEQRFNEVCGGSVYKFFIGDKGRSCTIRAVFEFNNRETALESWNTVKDQLKTEN